MSEENLFNLPKINVEEFRRNFIRVAVCELRFPTLLEIEKNPPVKFQSLIRKEYPHFETRTNIDFKPGIETKENFYVFLSKKKHWTITFKSSSISLETNKYVGFTEFNKRLEHLLETSRKIIDSNFFIRVGLRYIDVIPVDEKDNIQEWIREELVKPLLSGAYGKPHHYWQEILSNSKNGQFIFKHGIQKSNYNEYIFDFDFFEENVDEKNIIEVIKKLHDDSLQLFLWALGEKSIAYLKKDEG